MTVAGSIILHHFGLWAGYDERRRDDDAEAKFAVDPLPDGATRARTEQELRVREQRARERAEANADTGAAAAAAMANVFGDAGSSSSSDGE